MKRKAFVSIICILLVYCTVVFTVIESKMFSLRNIWKELAMWETEFEHLRDIKDEVSFYNYCLSADTERLADKLSDKAVEFHRGFIGKYTKVGNYAYLLEIQSRKIKRVIEDVTTSEIEDSTWAAFIYYTEDIIIQDPPIEYYMIKYLIYYIVICAIGVLMSVIIIRKPFANGRGRCR